MESCVREAWAEDAAEQDVLNGSECWAANKKDESELNSAEMSTLRWERGKTRLDRIRNDNRKEKHIKPLSWKAED